MGMKHNMWFCGNTICFAMLAVLAACVMAEDDRIIETKQGKVSGIKQSVISHTVIAYLGIPYAEAPTGEKRFQKPQPRAPWHSIYKATTYGDSCYQSKGEEYSDFPGIDNWIVKNEMSLNLNIWVPQSGSKPAHVMVFIHGGGFISGSSSLAVHDGSVLAASEEVIVVTMNYRIGALGFLAFPGNAKAPGNAGLFDQRLALQWVHENIEAFGGNPENITIFGVSAGGASVGYHVISPGSQSYFKRAIIQSGTPTADWAINSHEHSRKLSLQLAKILKCPTEDDDATIACLQKVNAEQFVEKQMLSVSEDALTHFVPVMDNDFLTDIPKNLVKTPIINTDILIGVTKDDGKPFAVLGAPGFNVKNQSLISADQLKEGLRHFFPPADDISVELMMLLYRDWDDEKSTEKNRNALEQILKDNYFTCPAKYFAKFAANSNNKLYVYEYEELPEWMGVTHGAEMRILFGKPLVFTQTYSNQEQDFSRRLMKLWTNFAREGNPSDDKFNWPEYSDEEQSYAILKVDRIDVKQKWNSQKCQFWNYLYPKLGGKMTHQGKS